MIGGVVLGGEGVVVAADRLDPRRELAFGMGLGALEHQVFEEVGDARLARRIVGGADPVPHHVRHDRGAMVGDDDDLEPVGEGEADRVGGEFRRVAASESGASPPAGARQKRPPPRVSWGGGSRRFSMPRESRRLCRRRTYSGRMWPIQSSPQKDDLRIPDPAACRCTARPGTAAISAEAASSRTTRAPGLSQPPARAEASACLAEALAIGRVGEDQRERRHGAGRPQPGGVAAEDAGAPGEAQRLDIGADGAARRHRLLDEERKGRAARQRLEAERAGAGEEVEHAGALQHIAMAVGENVEDRLAQAVGGRPRVAAGGRGERAAAKLTADDAHGPLPPACGAGPACGASAPPAPAAPASAAGAAAR